MGTNVKIGITEAGDAALDFSWISKMDTLDGAVLITKNLTDKLIEKILEYKDKVILHATCTGMGGTVIEPNVPVYTHQLAQVSKLLAAGFPENQLVIRIDPIVPTEKGLKTAQKVIDASPIKHFRISVMDTYPHVRERFKAHNVPLPYGENFQASFAQFKEMRKWLAGQNPHYVFEVCAEPNLAGATNVKTVGCVSEKDLLTLGLPIDGDYQTGLQRKGCMCLFCKTELLTNKNRCPHGCLYCYWRDAKCVNTEKIHEKFIDTPTGLNEKSDVSAEI